jgi:hypothetical protein
MTTDDAGTTRDDDGLPKAASAPKVDAPIATLAE